MGELRQYKILNDAFTTPPSGSGLASSDFNHTESI